MNNAQLLWWQQAQSDHDVFVLLRKAGVAQCHVIHYLQMVSEKLAKAYFWRSGVAPPRSHAGFVKFLRFLCQIRQTDRERVAGLFTFKSFDDFQYWVRKVLPIAYDLERVSPDLANQGPNPEYPWPHDNPVSAPVNHTFTVWASLTSGTGRDLMRILEIAVQRFPEYADL